MNGNDINGSSRDAVSGPVLFLEEGREIDEISDRRSNGDMSTAVDVYPLSCYYFGSKVAIPDKDATLADRFCRLKANYADRGMRICVEGVLLVEIYEHPHVLLLQEKNSIFKLPGGRLRQGESDIEGLKRKLTRKLSPERAGGNNNWQIVECIGMWWRSQFETLPFPYVPQNPRKPKECTKLFLVKLPMSRQFIVPRNFKLLAVPLCQLHDNGKTYGPIVSGIPHLLSRYCFNIVR